MIGGSVQAEPGHGSLRIFGGTVVAGDVQIKGATSFSFCSGTTIGGNFQAEENLAAGAFSCTIGGDLQLNKNAFIRAFSNTVGGNLQCKENGSALGGGNAVTGDKEDQCAGF